MRSRIRTERAAWRTALILGPAVPVLLVGVLLAGYVRSFTTERATSNAATAASLVADAAIDPLLEPTDFTVIELDPGRIEELDAALRPLLGDQIVRVRIWAADGRVVYDDDLSTIGTTLPVSDDLVEVLDGAVISEVTELTRYENVLEQDFDRLLEVYVPVGAGDDGQHIGAFEIYLPYEPIAASIREDSLRVLLLLAGILTLLYVALARVALITARTRRRAEDKEHEANHDSLTGLPNRRKYESDLDALRSGGGDGLVAVMFIDLDDFKTVNDRYGHAVGDALLSNAAARMRGALRCDAVLARLGGDEFGVAVPFVDDVADARSIARRLIESLATPIRVDDLLLDVGASIGIDVIPADELDAATSQRRADIAMYLAKRAGKGQLAMFDSVVPPGPSDLVESERIVEAVEIPVS